MTDLLESLDESLPGFFTLGQLFVDIVSELLDFVPDTLSGFTLEFTSLQTLGSLLALLFELVEIDTLLALLFGWARLVGGLFGIVGQVARGIGKDVSGKEDDVGTNLSELGRGDNQARNGAERLDGSLRVSRQLLARGGSRRGVDIDINVGVGRVVLQHPDQLMVPEGGRGERTKKFCKRSSPFFSSPQVRAVLRTFLTFSRTREPSAPNRAVRVLGPPDDLSVSELTTSSSNLDSCCWDLRGDQLRLPWDHRVQRREDIRELSSCEGAARLGDLNPLALGRNVCLDISSRWQRGGRWAVDAAREEGSTFRHCSD